MASSFDRPSFRLVLVFILKGQMRKKIWTDEWTDERKLKKIGTDEKKKKDETKRKREKDKDKSK